MLHTGRTYHTIKGGRKFFIHATRNRPASNGCNYIGEDLRTGVVAFFDHKGKHAWDETFNLECDPYLWLGMLYADKVHLNEFVKRDKLSGDYTWYLRMEALKPETITCVDRATFLSTYL